MVIKLQPTQVSALWEAIKVSAVKANKIPENFEQAYANKVLEALLSGRYEAWVLYSETNQERHIHAIGITSIVEDTMQGFTYLSMHTLFGFRPLTDELKLETWEAMKAYGKANGCHKLMTTTGHPRIKELAEMVGMSEESTTYGYTL